MASRFLFCTRSGCQSCLELPSGDRVRADKGQKNGQAVVTVTDDVGNVISGVTVRGTFAGTFAETVAGSTDGSGQATLTTSGQAKKGIAFTFCVDTISASGSLVYTPDADCAAY
jgi:hypothetical protein